MDVQSTTMMLKTNTTHFLCALAIVTTCTGVAAQVPTEDVKVGTQLDGTGIKLSTFTKPLPLPVGKWEVVGRDDYQIALTGNGATSAPMVNLTLRNMDKSNALVAMTATYSPEAIRIRWGGNVKCGNDKAALVDDFGTTTSSLTYACATAYFKTNSLKKYILDSPANKSDWVKARFSPLIPFADDMPDAHVWTYMGMNRDRGRNIAFTFLTRSPSNLKVGDKADLDLHTWAKATGAAYIEFLDNSASAVPTYPEEEIAAKN